MKQAWNVSALKHTSVNGKVVVGWGTDPWGVIRWLQNWKLFFFCMAAISSSWQCRTVPLVGLVISWVPIMITIQLHCFKLKFHFYSFYTLLSLNPVRAKKLTTFHLSWILLLYHAWTWHLPLIIGLAVDLVPLMFYCVPPGLLLVIRHKVATAASLVHLWPVLQQHLHHTHVLVHHRQVETGFTWSDKGGIEIIVHMLTCSNCTTHV